jgi:hypothetical protein
VLTMHTLSHVVLHKLPHRELAFAVGVEHPQLLAGLSFGLHLDLLDSNSCAILGGDHNYPNVSAEVIHE